MPSSRLKTELSRKDCLKMSSQNWYIKRTEDIFYIGIGINKIDNFVENLESDKLGWSMQSHLHMLNVNINCV